MGIEKKVKKCKILYKYNINKIKHNIFINLTNLHKK